MIARLLFLLLLYKTTRCEKALAPKQTALFVPKISEKCKNIKCSMQEDPRCVKIQNLKNEKNGNAIYIIVLNKCEIEYMECVKDFDAKIVSMKYCGHQNLTMKVKSNAGNSGSGHRRYKRGVRKQRFVVSNKNWISKGQKAEDQAKGEDDYNSYEGEAGYKVRLDEEIESYSDDAPVQKGPQKLLGPVFQPRADSQKSKNTTKIIPEIKPRAALLNRARNNAGGGVGLVGAYWKRPPRLPTMVPNNGQFRPDLKKIWQEIKTQGQRPLSSNVGNADRDGPVIIEGGKWKSWESQFGPDMSKKMNWQETKTQDQRPPSSNEKADGPETLTARPLELKWPPFKGMVPVPLPPYEMYPGYHGHRGHHGYHGVPLSNQVHLQEDKPFPLFSEESLYSTTQMYDQNINNTEQCPPFCPARGQMVCGVCQHGIYKTFTSSCHMRMFSCKYSDETMELVSRHPCILSAPYIAQAGVLASSKMIDDSEGDQVLSFIKCRSLGLLRQQDPRCPF